MAQVSVRISVLFVLTLSNSLAFTQTVTPEAKRPDTEWLQLFNGQDLDGWEANMHPESFTVEDGLLKAHGIHGMSHLFFVGGEKKTAVFKDFELVVTARSASNSNSGIFFHTNRELRGGKYLNKGYEVQLNSSKKEKQKTGSLYAIRPVDVSPVDETAWFQLRVLVNGKRIRVFVNAQQVVDYEEPAKPERPQSRAKRLIDPHGGAIAIQAHDPQSVFYFKEIRIRELEPKKSIVAPEPKSADASKSSVIENEPTSIDVAVNSEADAKAFFRKKVTPFIRSYCLDCHQNKRPTEAGVNFSPALKHPGHAAFSQQWRKAVARVRAHDMPPEDMEQPSLEERDMFSQWLQYVKYLSPKDPGPSVIRRLTKMEYGNTLRDLLGIDPSLANILPDEVSGEGFLNSVSPLQMEQYLSVAQQAIDQLFASDRQQAAAIDPDLENRNKIEKEGAAAVRSIASSLARKAYRRPPTVAEVDVLVDVFDLGKQNELDSEAAFKLMLKAILVSPQFLFITPVPAVAEQVESTTVSIVPLDDHQLAARLSYLLWATMPDTELSNLADSGQLREPETLRAQVRRMLLDQRSRALFDGFGAQWLKVNRLADQEFDPQLFPQMTNKMRLAMFDEVRLLFETIMRENLSVSSLIDSDTTYLNSDLAEIYGVAGLGSAEDMRKFKLTDRNRGGVLAMPGILAVTSFPNRTSAVNRGVWVLEQILGEHVPSAPPNVPALETQQEQATSALTLRERTELHRKDPVCANCHRILDPIGFGLENFDAIGRWRNEDNNGKAIDAAGELPSGEKFSTPQELKRLLKNRIDDIARNLVEKLLAYALCRRLEGYDAIVVDELMQVIAKDDYRMQTLITEVVTSYPFTHRRVETRN